jgi:hypothetical protein
MRHKKLLIQGSIALLTIWLIVFAVRSWAGSKKVTATTVEKAVNSANFDDWSNPEVMQSEAAAQQREEKIREVAALSNRLDFVEREKSRLNRSGEKFFHRLNSTERTLFIELTVAETMNQFMEALDQMPPAERKKFVEQGMREIEKGSTEEEMKRTQELGDDVMKKVTEEGMRAYFEKANAETKLDLAPLMESMNEVMQGLRGNRFGQ